MVDIDPRIDPSTIPLRPEEKLISAQLVDIKKPKKPLSALEALQLLAGVDRPEDIGKRGPVVASRIYSGHEAVIALRLYEVVFGRDSLIVARLVEDQFPELTHTTVEYLAQRQGKRYNESAEEEPGKIVHENRPPEDPIAISLTKTRSWGWPYYGSVDATPLFITAAFASDQAGVLEKNVQAAARWLLKKMSENPEGLLESRPLNPKGQNMIQSWKDSLDSHHHADGSLANFSAGIASIEVQGYVYDALLACGLKTKAEKLRAVILEKFWIEDEKGGYFALGSDRDASGKLRLLDVRTSNIGHLLTSQLLDGDDVQDIREKLVKTLFSEELLSKRGIRTLATHENRYRPNSYHNGSVWPWDTMWISLGLLRHGYTKEAKDLWGRILAMIAETKRFPEFVSGDDIQPPLNRRRIVVHDTHYNFNNTIEQSPQEIQSWTVASVVAIEHLQRKYGRISK